MPGDGKFSAGLTLPYEELFDFKFKFSRDLIENDFV